MAVLRGRQQGARRCDGTASMTVSDEGEVKSDHLLADEFVDHRIAVERMVGPLDVRNGRPAKVSLPGKGLGTSSVEQMGIPSPGL